MSTNLTATVVPAPAADADESVAQVVAIAASDDALSLHGRRARLTSLDSTGQSSTDEGVLIVKLAGYEQRTDTDAYDPTVLNQGASGNGRGYVASVLFADGLHEWSVIRVDHEPQENGRYERVYRAERGVQSLTLA